MTQVQYLKKTALVAWRGDDGTTHRGSATTPNLAKAWAKAMNEKHPGIKHWVEIAFCSDEEKQALIALGYSPESLGTERDFQRAFDLQVQLGRIV